MESLRPRILCTEDDRDTREMIAIILTGAKFEVICTESPDEAIDLARRHSFDLFLVDNWMPGLSGTELARRLRAFDAKTPILFYSGAAYEKDREAARSAGAQGYLVKPVEINVLIDEVNRLIAESRIVQPVQAAVA